MPLTAPQRTAIISNSFADRDRRNVRRFEMIKPELVDLAETISVLPRGTSASTMRTAAGAKASKIDDAELEHFATVVWDVVDPLPVPEPSI